MSAALTVSGAGTATAALAPPPTPSLVPARVGGSVSYHYDAIETGPRGTTTTRAVFTLTRVVNDRVTITVTPDEGPATAVVARFGKDGALRADSVDARSSVRPAGGAADASDIPLDRPLGGLPGDAREPSRYSVAGFTTNLEVRPEIPQSVRVISALLATRPATVTSARTWPFAATVQSSESSVAMTGRMGDARGTETTVIADGSGDVPIAAARGGAGGTGGGQRGGGVFFPGGGQGGQGGGVYGSGRGRRGGQGGGGQSPGGQNPAPVAQQRTVPATVNLHVESTFRAGRLALARGSDAVTTHATGADVTTTVRWTLTAL